MENNSYHRSLRVNASAGDAMEKISQVNNWWKKDFEGSAGQLQDHFKIPFGENAFVDFMVTEMAPGKKLTWKVTDCYLPWFTDNKEWNDTEVIFELEEEGDHTRIDFTHNGLVPTFECYGACEKGWDGHIQTSLKNFINEGIAI